MARSLIDRFLARVFGGTDEVENGLEALKAALQPPARGVNLHGYIGVPCIDTHCAETAVFTVQLLTDDEEFYGTTTLEFDIPQEGIAAEGARLNEFLSSFGIDSAEALDQIVGERVDVENVDGNWEVQW